MDVAGALEDAGGDSARLGERCAIFLRESPRLMEELLLALQQGDGQAVRHHAHQLKNSVAAIGGTQVHARALSIENSAAVGRLHDLQLVTAPLKRELRELRKAVKGFLSSAAQSAPVSLAIPPALGPVLVYPNRSRGAA